MPIVVAPRKTNSHKGRRYYLLMCFPLLRVKGVQDPEPANVAHVPVQVDTCVPKAAFASSRIGTQLLVAAFGAAGLGVIQATADGIQVGVWLYLGAALGVAAAPRAAHHTRACLLLSQARKI